jgi:hypothetical protein
VRAAGSLSGCGHGQSVCGFAAEFEVRGEDGQLIKEAADSRPMGLQWRSSDRPFKESLMKITTPSIWPEVKKRAFQ